ncbi:MAG: phosphoserine transaminase [Alphaproteobacteria bacterium]|jgi:phosphoserine aminotransferase|nr:phosphoserine transaminase [Alphaproteobacteria bacterium]MDP7221638.1 phosphoserine transaminase [Alphaproteobacteria bacterium]
MSSAKPSAKPNNPNFSSGPCSKRPGWSLDALSDALTGRSHRSGPGKAKLAEVIDRHRALLGIPDDYHVGIVPASDTGAFEMAMWSMLGARGVDVLAWESFSGDWLKDVTGQLKLDDVNTYKADYGDLPDLSAVDFNNDVVFVWNGTTSGVRVPDGEWIDVDRAGLTFCDATSAVFAYDLPWDKLDVTTWSWQKVLGGEAAHGMLVLSPRAVARLESYVPARGLPKIFRMTKGDKLNAGIFKGATINTPSMIAVEDCLDALKWVESIGGVAATIKRSEDNFAALADWVSKTDWVDFLPADEAVRSTTSICLKVVDPWFTAQSDEVQGAIIGALAKRLDQDGVAYDIKGYRDAPHGLRIWGGATIERADIDALCPWLDWAYETVKAEQPAKAA